MGMCAGDTEQKQATCPHLYSAQGSSDAGCGPIPNFRVSCFFVHVSKMSLYVSSFSARRWQKKRWKRHPNTNNTKTGKNPGNKLLFFVALGREREKKSARKKLHAGAYRIPQKTMVLFMEHTRNTLFALRTQVFLIDGWVLPPHKCFLLYFFSCRRRPKFAGQQKKDSTQEIKHRSHCEIESPQTPTEKKTRYSTRSTRDSGFRFAKPSFAGGERGGRRRVCARTKAPPRPPSNNLHYRRLPFSPTR